MKGKIPALAKRSLALALALALLLSLCPVIPLTAKAAHTGEWTYLVKGSEDYKWISGAFTADDADLIYADDQPYDWKVTVQPTKTPPPTVDVVATIKDANGNQVDTYTGTANLGKNALVTLFTAANFAKLTTELAGNFTLICDVNYGGKTYAHLEQTFSRTIAGAEVETTEGAEVETTEGAEVETTVATEPDPDEKFTFTDGWSHGAADSKQQLQGYFITTEEDLAYEGDKAFDWTFELAQSIANATFTAYAKILNENNEVLFELEKPVSSVRYEQGLVISAEDFPELTADMVGNFILKCQIVFNGKDYGTMTQRFSRTGATGEGGENEDEEVLEDGWTSSSKYTWINAAFNSADDDLVFEGEQAYDWTFTLQQEKDTVQVGISAVIKDAKGNIVSTVTKTADAYKSATPSEVLNASEFAELAENYNGEYVLICDVTYNGSPVGRLIQHFTRTGGVDAEGGETPDTPVVPDTAVTTAKAYLDILQEVVLENMTACDGYNFTASAPYTLKTIKAGDLVAWDMGPNVALQFTLSEEFMKDFDGNATITVEYVESSNGTAQLVYPNAESTEFVHATTITADGSNTREVKSVTFELTDAVFANLFGKGYSFAIMGTPESDGRFYLKSVTVTKPGAVEPGNTYTLDLTSASDVADLKFYDETPFDLTLDATTSGNLEVVTATYSLTGGNLAEAVTGTKTVTLSKEGVNVLDSAWFNENAEGFGVFTLEVALSNEEGTIATKTLTFSRDYTSILSSNLTSETAENKDGVLVFGEDAAMDLELFLKNKLAVPFSGTLTYTVAYNGTILDGCNEVSLEITDLFGDASEIEGLLLPEAAEYGIYELAINVYDEDGNNVHGAFYRFARQKAEFINANVSSETAGEEMVFVDEAPYDLVLDLQKADGFEEPLTISYEVLKGEEVVKAGSFEQLVAATAAYTLRATPSAQVDLSEILADVAGYGDFVLKIKVTNTLGYDQEFSYSFSRVESIKVELTSPSHPTLFFKDEEAYDLQLVLQKLIGEDGVYTVDYTVANGETVVKTGSMADVSVTGTAGVMGLDMADVAGNGVFTITVTLTDAEGNIAKTSQFKVTRSSSIAAEILFQGNEAGYELPTFIDLVTIQSAVSLKKPVGDVEAMTINYVVTDKDGNEVISGTTTRNVGTTAVNAVLDLAAVKEFGTYTITASVLDAASNEVATASAQFVRVETVTTALTSATNSDLVFTEGEAWDMVLHLKKEGEPEAFKAIITITDANGNVLIEKNASVPANFTKTALSNIVDLSVLPAIGAFTMSLKMGDADNRLREEATFSFSRVALDGSVEAAIKSSTTAELVYGVGSELDMQLHIQKVDEIPESFAALLVITDKDGNELAKLDAPLNTFLTRKFALKDLVDLSAITATGAYNIYFKLTDNSGYVRHESNTTFTIISTEGSLEAAITSSTNPDLIFTEGEEFDLVLHMRKTDEVAEAFKAIITLTDKDGNVLKEKEARVPATVAMKTAVSNLVDLSDLPATGSFILKLVMIDAGNNERLSLEAPFHRVKLASVKTQISSNTNKDMIFTDNDTVDLTMYAQKTDNVAEELILYYSILDPDGNEIATAEGKTVVPAGSSYFKLPIELAAEDVAAHGRYKAIMMVMDNNGNIRSETETPFVRISGTGIKHQVSGSSTGTKMQFTPGMKIDLCLFAQKTDGVAESVNANLYVTAPSGAVVFSITGKLNIPATGYFKFALPLDGKCNEFGTYKVSYTFHDDAGNLRASNVAAFKMISPTGELAVAVQSASGKFPGLIYGKDDAFDLNLYIQKADGVEQTLKLRYTIYDMNGLVLETKQGNINAPALGYRKLAIELPDNEAFQKYGIFTMKVEIAGPTGELIYNEEFPFTRVMTPETQLGVMGVCTHLSKKGMTTKQAQQYVDLARQAGASFWRDELPWSTVEPAKGQYRIPESADAAVDYTLSINLQPLFILDYGNDNYGSDVTTDEWLEGYLGYVRYMVTHFKGRIMYYEVWNEWNIGLGGMDKKYRDYPELYAKLLVETYKVIKEIDPEITVIGGVVAGGELDWTEGMLKYPGAIDSMDAYSFHLYPDNDMKEVVEQVKDLNELFEEYGRPNIPLWLTETGWPTHIGRNSFSEETSAGNLVSLYTWAIANPDAIDRIFWYDLHNDGIEREYLEHNLGLLHNWNVDEVNVPMAAKPSYVAMSAMNAILGDAEYVGEYDLGHKKITAYHFKKDGKDMLVTWADDTALNMIADVGENNIIVTDMYGNASALTPVDGKVSLFFSDAPIYIEYDLTNKLDLVEGGFELDQDMYSVSPAVTFPVKITRNNGLETQSGSYAFSMPDTWSVENIEFGAAEAGATEIVDTVYVTVGDDASKGEMTITARVVIGGNVVGQFSIPIEMGDICTVNPDVFFTEDGTPEFKLSVQVLNEKSNKPLTGTINLLAPKALLGESSSVPFEIPAGENQAVLIDIPAEFANTFHNVKIEVVLQSGVKHEVNKPVSFLYAIKAPENMKLDGVIDDQWDGAMEFSAGEDDWEIHTGAISEEWPGNTFKGYAMWDNEYLYVAVIAHDDSHCQDGTGTSIWMGDSIQLATDVTRFTVPGYYGYSEVGASLSTDGSTIENWNWYAAPGKNVSEGGIFKIVRDDATATTVYEVAVPWNEQLPNGATFDPDTLRSIGFSIILNENSFDEDGDPTGRTGWVEYMSGVGRRKDPMLFGDLILVERPTK